jgi:UDP-3-O-[3-hydroxymyristoyl] glucosamine N-acyltransferase
MVNQKFYDKRRDLTIGDICGALGIDAPHGCLPTKIVEDVTSLDIAGSSDITFFHNSKYAGALAQTKALACLVSRNNSHLIPQSTISLIVDEPYQAYAVALGLLYSVIESHTDSFISQKASIAKSAIIEDGCHISDFVVIEDNSVIRTGTVIGENTVIMRGVEVGERSHIEPNVTIGFAIIGKNAHIKTGARIGQKGFGFHISKSGPTDIPHVGTVIIGNNALIGANCTIDRGSVSDTVIGDNVRMDNMVHIAHNVTVGTGCIIAAQTGIAGSTALGNACVLGGQVGVAGHLVIGNNVTIAAQSGVMRNIPQKSKIAGSPSVSIMAWRRQTIALQALAQKSGVSGRKRGIRELVKTIFRRFLS